MHPSNVEREEERRRIRWRCRRGMRELEILLYDFVERGYPHLPEHERKGFERLLEQPDPLLYQWLMGWSDPMERELAHVVARIRTCRPH